MLNTITEITVAVFAVIGLYELISQLCNYFVRRTKNAHSYKTQIRITLDKTNSEHTEFVLRSLLSSCDSGILKNAEIVVVDDGIDADAKKIVEIFEDAVTRIKTEKL